MAFELLEGYDGLLLIDAVPMGELPGTLALIEPDADAIDSRGNDESPIVDAHTMNPAVVLATLARLGGSVGNILIVGCQPANVQEGMGLTPDVAAAVDDAAQLCCELVSHMVEPVTKGARA